MKHVRMSLLIALLVVTMATAVIAGLQFQSARQRAETSAAELETCRANLTDIRIAGTSAATSVTTASADSGGINQLLREAATTAGAGSSLTSIEPGQPARIEGTDYQETPVFLRVDALPMKQLVTFLYEASARDSRARCRSIELSSTTSADSWSADVTMGYLSYSPRKGVRQ